MATTFEQLVGSMAFEATGDVGPLTCYTNRRQTVWFLKAWLSDPATPRQIAHRDRVRAAARLWKQLCPGARRRWEIVSKKAGTKLTGYNLWVHWIMTGEDGPIETISRQAGHTLLPPIFADDTLCSAAYNDVTY
jgi:hypothetical protein